MKKLLSLLLLVGILVSTSAMAQPINLLGDSTTMTTEVTENMLDEPTLNELNNNVFIQTLIKGYSKIGIKVESAYYLANIDNDKLIAIEPSYSQEKFDYVIATDFSEMIYIFANYEKMSTVELMRTLVMNKDVPVDVVMDLAGVFMRGEL